MSDDVFGEPVFHVDEIERYLRAELAKLDGLPDDELTDVEAPDGHRKTVAESREDDRAALARLVVARYFRERQA